MAALLALPRLGRRALAAVAAAGLVVALSGSAAYALDTAATTHRGAIPSAGPGVPGGFGPGGRPGPGGRAMLGGPGRGGPFGGQGIPGGQGPQGGQGVFGALGTGAGRGGVGGLLDGGTPGAELVALLRQGDYTWAAATVGANSAAGIQLASDRPVMAIGGFNGSDPAPTLAQFQQYVAAGKIHYFIAGGGAGGPGGGVSGTASQISSWVRQHFTARTVDGTTIYDLTPPASATAGGTTGA